MMVPTEHFLRVLRRAALWKAMRALVLAVGRDLPDTNNTPVGAVDANLRARRKRLRCDGAVFGLLKIRAGSAQLDQALYMIRGLGAR